MNMMREVDVGQVNARFNGFHDGFIKNISVTGAGEFVTGLPWEDEKSFASNEEELHATGHGQLIIKSLAMSIHHYNYAAIHVNLPIRHWMIGKLT